MTRREAEILQLVAQGESDLKIAASLGISIRTVGKHVENILAKLGVPNRAAAAVAWVSLRVPPKNAKANKEP